MFHGEPAVKSGGGRRSELLCVIRVGRTSRSPALVQLSLIALIFENLIRLNISALIRSCVK